MKKLKDFHCSYAAKWRWAVTICNNRLCSIKAKHLRGYKKCICNDHTFAEFERKMG